jgi:probable H4MPT-linked C1 transfer pathway protein
MVCSVLGLDIGGANLKAAHTDGCARLQPFELWRHPAGLPAALRALIDAMPPADTLAVTMTGELCDCFETKRQGVRAILDAVATVAGSRRVRVWRSDARLVSVSEAQAAPLAAAAANWLALATFVGRYAPTGAALLIDIGSTTTDVIPLLNGRPVPRGRTDPERLRCHELVYTGVRRTPVCALLGASGAAELFATTLDVYLALGSLPEDPADRGTADGRPATREAAGARLARMLCADKESCTSDDIVNVAVRAHRAQMSAIEAAIGDVVRRQPEPPHTLCLAGAGEFLIRGVQPNVRELLGARIVSLMEQLGPASSEAACAHALAVLAREASDET